MELTVGHEGFSILSISDFNTANLIRYLQFVGDAGTVELAEAGWLKIGVIAENRTPTTPQLTRHRYLYRYLPVPKFLVRARAFKVSNNVAPDALELLPYKFTYVYLYNFKYGLVKYEYIDTLIHLGTQ